MYELASLLVYPGGPSAEPIATIPISTAISSAAATTRWPTSMFNYDPAEQQQYTFSATFC